MKLCGVGEPAHRQRQPADEMRGGVVENIRQYLVPETSLAIALQCRKKLRDLRRFYGRPNHVRSAEGASDAIAAALSKNPLMTVWWCNAIGNQGKPNRRLVNRRMAEHWNARAWNLPLCRLPHCAAPTANRGITERSKERDIDTERSRRHSSTDKPFHTRVTHE